MQILLCGLGGMGRNHLRVLRELTQCTVAGVVEPDPRQHSTALGVPGCQIHTELEAALDALLPDAVIVASPTVTHGDMARRVLERGLPLLIEKPLCRSAAEAEDICALASEKGSAVMVGHVERFNPAVVAAQRIVKSGQLGDIIHVSARRVGGTPEDVDKAGDVLVDLAVHDIDIITWLLGEPELHSALGYKRAQVQSATLLLQAGLTTIDIHVNWVTPVKIRHLEITGSQGHLDVNLITQQVSWIKQNPVLTQTVADDCFFYQDYLLSFATPDRIEVGIQRREPLRAQLQAFLAALQKPEPRAAIPVNERDGLSALRLAERARRIIEEKGAREP